MQTSHTNMTLLYQKERVSVTNHANEDAGALGSKTAKNLVKLTVPHSAPAGDVSVQDHENAVTCFVLVGVLDLLKKTVLLARTFTMMECAKKSAHLCKDIIPSIISGSKTLTEDMRMVQLV